MGQPLITALIDTCNHERFITEAIESVLAQGLSAQELEIVVVDDGSTDGTAACVHKFTSQVRYIHKPNGGQASAFNAGFREARGEIVALLDGDDVWLPGKLRRVIAEFARHPEAGMVYHPNQNWDAEKGTSYEEAGFFPISGDVPADPNLLMRYGNFSTSGMALRRSVVERLLPVPEELVIYADTYLIYLIIFIAPVVAINEHLTRYRHYDGNLAAYGGGDRDRQQRRWRCYQSAVGHIRAWLERNGHDTTQAGIADFLERHRLVAEYFRFLHAPPSHGEFFRHLRTQERLYGRFWSRSYRAFRAAASGLGFLLGYNTYEALRNRYRKAGAIQARESLLPTHAAPTSARSASAPTS